jgi:hypothetical protein
VSLSPLLDMLLLLHSSHVILLFASLVLGSNHQPSNPNLVPSFFSSRFVFSSILPSFLLPRHSLSSFRLSAVARFHIRARSSFRNGNGRPLLRRLLETQLVCLFPLLCLVADLCFRPSSDTHRIPHGRGFLSSFHQVWLVRLVLLASDRVIHELYRLTVRR